jgi:hypothetical protein
MICYTVVTTGYQPQTGKSLLAHPPDKPMHKKLNNHLISILFVGILFFVINTLFETDTSEDNYSDLSLIRSYTELEFLDLNSPEDRMLLREVLNIYEPQNRAFHDSLLAEIEQYLTNRMLAAAGSRQNIQGIDGKKILTIVSMLLKFSAVYILVLLVTYYGVETFAVYRFIHEKYSLSFFKQLSGLAHKITQAKSFKIKTIYFLKMIVRTVRIVLKGLMTLILFAPAYVIAYSFKTSFDTDSILLMIILGVISNGLLITYTQKYYTFLVSESRKGYVQTAVVKNLNARFDFDKNAGISIASLFKVNKKFPGHIFDQIYENVRFQYLNTLKEQASFLITGLIIIEMALNIQGHLCYELMQNILYKNLSVVLVILFGIFLVVKLTQIIIDVIVFKQQRRIGIVSSEEIE